MKEKRNEKKRTTTPNRSHKKSDLGKKIVIYIMLVAMLGTTIFSGLAAFM